MSDRDHTLHHAHLPLLSNREEVLALHLPPGRRLERDSFFPCAQPKKEGAGVTLQDRGAKGKLVLTSGIFAGIAVPKFRVKPSGSSCALADRPRRLRRLFKLNKSFLMIPVDEKMQRVKTRPEQRK